MKKFIYAFPVWWATATMVVAIAYLSLSEDPMTPSIDFIPDLDKYAHSFLYFLLTLALLFDYNKFIYPHHPKGRREFTFLWVSILFGLLMETCQMATINRSFEFLDILADACGAFAAFIFYEHVIRARLRHLLKKYSHHHHHHHKSKGLKG